MSEDIFDYIESAEASNEHIRYQNFEERLHQDATGSYKPSEIKKILEFISNQHGYWSAQWTFSPAANPDTEASSEAENWENLWQAFAKSLEEIAPEAIDHVAQLHKLTILEHTVKRRVTYNESKPFERFVTGAMSNSAILLNKLGLSGIANYLYSLSLYPKGTVGHG